MTGSSPRLSIGSCNEGSRTLVPAQLCIYIAMTVWVPEAFISIQVMQISPEYYCIFPF